jgi:predicted acyltransferase
LEKQRVLSIDIFRGLTMMLMTIVNNPGDWGNVYPPLLHAKWHGATPTDLVFPFFVFIMGAALPFSSNENGGIDRNSFLKILTRSLRIFNLGLFLNFFSKIEFLNLEGLNLTFIRLLFSVIVAYLMLGNFSLNVKFLWAVLLFFFLFFLSFGGFAEYSKVRIPGVLQRIAIVYFFSALIFFGFKIRYQVYIGASILLSYWLVMALVPIPGHETGNYGEGTNLAAWLDNYLLEGHLWITTKTWDPEGVLSTFPAVVTALLGIWAGHLVKNKKEAAIQWLMFLGVGLLILGKLWAIVFPINKALWTSSFVLYTAGWAMLILGLVMFLVKHKPRLGKYTFFIMWGVNPMIVFYGSGILPRALNSIKIKEGHSDQSFLSYFYESICVPLFTNPMNASLFYALLYVVFWSIILYILHLKKIVIKV